jgi:hypothetical protein
VLLRDVRRDIGALRGELRIGFLGRTAQSSSLRRRSDRELICDAFLVGNLRVNQSMVLFHVEISTLISSSNYC